jgi:phage host-nuclease inhibitor protein Gam
MSGRNKDFYLGNTYDLETKALQEQQVFYDPDDLTTHAVITGMTGSGKTGLGVIMLEEAALLGIPAIVIDPKGDLTNLLLHFPELLPEDFQPWVDQDAARREGVSVEEAAEKAATLWKNGLASSGLGKSDLEALRDAVEYAVYTPGSDAGLPVSILASFSAPDIPWEGNREILRERISSTVTALLGLIGMRNIDPVQSKEHILLSNIFEEAWKAGKDLDLATLITHVQSPPFDKLGVFSLDQFYPQKDRFSLAMQLNNFLAAPSFHTWLEGQPLDIGQILWSPSGKPRHSVFYLAHLDDQERMFFVTLLYTAIESWMRTQKGSGSLRVMVYFDEIHGYLPPVSNPPSKTIILRLLKQARAFGVGLVLATQNPVDVDYKGLSNAGTWMIGRLQTEQDKARLLDGLEGAAPGVDRRSFDRMISLLGKRVFLLHNVHDSKPKTFHTRWAMNYLPGPLTRSQIPAVNALVKATERAAKRLAAAVLSSTSEESPAGLGRDVAPVLPGSVPTFYYPDNRGISDAQQEVGSQIKGDIPRPQYLYRPELVGQARAVYLARKYNISEEVTFTVRIDEMQRRGLVRWENYAVQPLDLRMLEDRPLSDATFDTLENLSIVDARLLKDLENDFTDWIYRTQTLKLRLNEALGVVAEPGDSEETFRRKCENAMQEKLQAEVDALTKKHASQLKTLEDKLSREESRLDNYKSQLGHRRLEEAGKLAETVLGLARGRSRSVSSSLTKRRMTSQAKANVEKSELEIKNITRDIERIKSEQKDELAKVEQKWAETLEKVVDEPVSAYKKDIYVDRFALLWLPYYAFIKGEERVIVPAFRWGS